MSSSKLFRPIQVGNLTLKHRVVLAPLTRFRATGSHAPGPLAVEYYSQRASAPGTLLITEATLVAAKAGSYSNVPGIYTDEQIGGWKKVTDAVHARGSFIYLQLWALGRTADASFSHSEDSSIPYAAPSAIPLKGRSVTPRELTVAEIKELVKLYGTAASNAVHRAGFDGVEIHGANGYLVDQFLQDVSNHRSDAYGGSIENRSRFALEVVDAVVKAVGESKTAIRLSPWSTFQDMGMKDPVPQFSHVVSRIRDLHPNLSYIHVVEARIDGSFERDAAAAAGQSNEFIRKIWDSRPLVFAGGYAREDAIDAADNKNVLVAFGRHFIANPDLPLRLKNGIQLAKGTRDTYYAPGDFTPKGYTDYPYAEHFEQIESHL